MENKEEYWFVDTGYISKQIHRYPEPKILDEKELTLEYVKVVFILTKVK